MKNYCFASFSLALVLACAPASAQSPSDPIVGQFPTIRAERAPASVTIERLVEIAAERACPRPYIRDLRGQALRARCLIEARAVALAQTEALQQLASR